ncbi:MAG: valine--tRNA ligase [Vicingaceae bacterium]
MIIDSKYDPSQVEDKWYSFWMEHRLFHSVPDDREPYTIVIPPPNVTGVLHMGHMLNNTIQDILIRRARLMGKNACWVPGTDHASIATEAKVVNLLAEEGVHKREIGREAFLERAWEWKEKHDGIIYGQLKRLGASCDWERSKFTLGSDLSESVLKAFKSLYNEGLIYRGARMINWDPKAKTALSDEEVIRKDVQSKLYYVKYLVEGSDQYLTVATTRPETILGDTAVCVHPDDERYTALKGKRVIVPIAGRSVPVIQDDYVDREFGTGALKITPAHDVNDYEIGLKHSLEVIDTLTDDGTMSEAAGYYIGEDRFKARKLIVIDLREQDLIEKEEDIQNNVGFSERNPDTVVEPRISTQWFLKMKDLVKPAIEAVKRDEVKIHPPKFKKVYFNWLDNIKDWCISRQLWWGHRIPAWYAPDGDFVIAVELEEALALFEEKGRKLQANEIHQDEDVLDTWFSSWLWPFSVFEWNEDEHNADLEYYYPTNDLVTGHDIIFFWVARMIIAGYHFTDKRPFENVYFTGMVRDNKGRKMSKSLGNSPDALDLMDRFGADGVRVGMLLSAPAGNDLQFDESLCLQGRNFANKLWNAFRLIKGWEVDESKPEDGVAAVAANWFENRLSQSLEGLDQQFSQFRISEALMTSYKLIWDDFCSWYLEMAKPAFGQKVDTLTLGKAIGFIDKLTRLIHPFMPFISEEIWQNIEDRNGTSIVHASWPDRSSFDDAILEKMQFNMDLISGIRQKRAEMNVGNKELLILYYQGSNDFLLADLIKKMAGIEEIKKRDDSNENLKSFVVGQHEFAIPFNDKIDVDEERARIQKELDYALGFLNSVDRKLANERFVSNAPEEVVAIEKKKQEDALNKVKLLEKQLASI